MSGAGGLEAVLRWDGRRALGVEIRDTRPSVSRLLLGKPAEEAVRLVPLLFSLCGKAQGACALAAREAAEGVAVPESVLAARADAILREAAFEHLWRLLLDWPAVLDLPRQDKALAEARRLQAAAANPAAWSRVLDGTLSTSLLGLPAAEWLGGDFAPWAGSDAPAAVMWRTLRERAGVITPIPAPATENSPLARLGKRLPVDLVPVEARFLARLAESALWAAGQVPSPERLLRAEGGAGSGEAHAIVARGRLRHRVRLEGGRVADYAISVPTDDNFRPGGPFAREVLGISGDTSAAIEAAARLLSLSLDPCVAVRFAVEKV